MAASSLPKWQPLMPEEATGWPNLFGLTPPTIAIVALAVLVCIFFEAIEKVPRGFDRIHRKMSSAWPEALHALEMVVVFTAGRLLLSACTEWSSGFWEWGKLENLYLVRELGLGKDWFLWFSWNDWWPICVEGRGCIFFLFFERWRGCIFPSNLDALLLKMDMLTHDCKMEDDRSLSLSLYIYHCCEISVLQIDTFNFGKKGSNTHFLVLKYPFSGP